MVIIIRENKRKNDSKWHTHTLHKNDNKQKRSISAWTCLHLYTNTIHIYPCRFFVLLHEHTNNNWNQKRKARARSQDSSKMTIESNQERKKCSLGMPTKEKKMKSNKRLKIHSHTHKNHYPWCKSFSPIVSFYFGNFFDVNSFATAPAMAFTFFLIISHSLFSLLLSFKGETTLHHSYINIALTNIIKEIIRCI